MSSETAYIRYLQYCVAWQLSLDREVELLHVRPHGVGWNGEHLQGELHRGSAGDVVAGKVVLIRGLYQWSRTLQGLGVAFIAVGVFEVDPKATADRKFPVAKDVISKAETGCGIEEVTRHATGRDTVETATDDAVEDVSGARYKCSCLACHRTVCVDRWRVRSLVCRWYEVSRLVADVVIGAEEAQ